MTDEHPPRTRRRPDVDSLELVGGAEALHVGLHDYDEAWPARYRQHADRIAAALRPHGGHTGTHSDTNPHSNTGTHSDTNPHSNTGTHSDTNPHSDTGTHTGIDIEHIGSTSVPGLAAKPIVDIVVAVDDITAEEDYLDPLLAAGYVLRVREPEHRLVRTPERDVHVHIYEKGHPAIGEYLLLRDHLRRDASDRALYEDTKRTLFERPWDDMNAYADAKTDVIVAIKERARRASP